MNASPKPEQRASPSRGGWLALALALVLCSIPVLCLVGITGYFRLSADAGALRESLLSSSANQWEKKIALHVGGFTTGILRVGSRFFALPPEPRAALEAVRGGEVGIYRLHRRPPIAERRTMLQRADQIMRARGWERVVGVIEREQLVGIYLPHRTLSARRINCCVFVLSEGDLVIASAQGNLQPLLELASQHLPAEYRPMLHL